MEYLRVRNWDRYQFKRGGKSWDPAAPVKWVKLYCSETLLDDKLPLLPAAAQLQFMRCLCLAGANHGHRILYDEHYLRTSLRLRPEDELYVDLLLEQRFLERERDRSKKPAEKRAKPEPAEEPGEPAEPKQRRLTQGQQLFELVVELGLKGERPPEEKTKYYCSVVVNRMLKKKPFEYWERAARAMNKTWPWSTRNWDLPELEKNAYKVVGGQSADQDGYVEVGDEDAKPEWLRRQEAMRR